MDLAVAREFLGYVLAGVAAIFWAVQSMRRRQSKNSVEIVKDRDEIDSTRIAREERIAMSAEVRALRVELTGAYKFGNDQLQEIGRLNAQLEAAMSIREQLAKASTDNLAATAAVGEKADAAYQVANTVNEKIEKIGLKMADNKPLEGHQHEGAEK